MSSKAVDDACIFDMIEYYKNAKGGIPQTVQDKAYSVLMSVSLDVRKKAIDWMYEHCKRNFGFDMSDLYQAVNEAKGYTTSYIPAEDWKCEACGLEFKYVQGTDEDDMIDKGLFDRCPRCMFDVQITKSAQHSINQTESAKKRYHECIVDHLKRWETQRDGKWWFNKQSWIEQREALKKRETDKKGKDLVRILDQSQEIKAIVDRILKKNYERNLVPEQKASGD